jgi:hypothetical protein
VGGWTTRASQSLYTAICGSTSRPGVADGGDGLQIWMVAANISNKQWRTAGNGWSSALEVGERRHFVRKCYAGRRN